jgi:hypothetical protein
VGVLNRLSPTGGHGSGDTGLTGNVAVLNNASPTGDKGTGDSLAAGNVAALNKGKSDRRYRFG